MLYEDSVIQ